MRHVGGNTTGGWSKGVVEETIDKLEGLTVVVLGGVRWKESGGEGEEVVVDDEKKLTMWKQKKKSTKENEKKEVDEKKNKWRGGGTMTVRLTWVAGA